MNRTDDEIQRDLSRSLLLGEGKKSDDASEEEEQDESSSRSNTSFSNWWGNNKNNNRRINESNGIINESNGLEMLQERDISRRKKRFDTLLRNEVAHETSATKNYILQNKKVHLSRICFALAAYSIASISSLPVADQAKLSREKKITLYFSGTIFGAIIAGLWYDQKGWYSSLVLSCSSLGLSAVITAVNILLLNLPPLAMISLALSAFGVGAMYPISALLSTSLSSIKFNDKQMALTNFSQFTGKAVAVVTSVFVLSVIARSDDYFTPNQAKLHNGILSIFGLFAVIYVLYVGSTIRKKFSVLYDLTDDNMGGMVVHASTLFRAIVLKKKSFAGAALAWFLFDFIYYGAGEYGYLNLIVEGSDTSIHVRDAKQSVKLLIYLPGYALALLIFSYHYYFDRKNLQVVGFILLAISYCIQWPLSSSIGNACEKYFVKSQYFETGHMKTNITSQSCFDKFHGRPVRYGSDPTDIYTQCRCGEWGLFYYLKVILVIFHYTICNSTLNATTFIISADSSPRYAPATFFGLAAAAGKIGAVFGLTILASKKDGQALNRQSKYPILIFASLLGAVLTVLFVPRRQKKI
jgi:MFS family permease